MYIALGLLIGLGFTVIIVDWFIKRKVEVKIEQGSSPNTTYAPVQFSSKELSDILMPEFKSMLDQAFKTGLKVKGEINPQKSAKSDILYKKAKDLVEIYFASFEPGERADMNEDIHNAMLQIKSIIEYDSQTQSLVAPAKSEVKPIII